MEYKLTKPFEIYSKEADKNIEVKTIHVLFTGVKGLRAIKSLQDTVMTCLQSAQKNAQSQTQVDTKKDVTVDDLLRGIEVIGMSEHVLDRVMSVLSEFGSCASRRLDSSIQNMMAMEDVQGLYEDVLRCFLLPTLCQNLNNMNK